MPLLYIPADRNDRELGDGPSPVKGRAVGEWHGSDDALPFLKATSKVFIICKCTLFTCFLLRYPFHIQTTFTRDHI